jgi:hypothetical protein
MPIGLILLNKLWPIPKFNNIFWNQQKKTRRKLSGNSPIPEKNGVKAKVRMMILPLWLLK